MENTIGNKAGTPEEKARFFAMYLGGEVIHTTEMPTKLTGGVLLTDAAYGKSYLSLRSIESLNESEILELCKLYDNGSNLKSEAKRREIATEIREAVISIIKNNDPGKSFLWDYLRSIGILIPFMGLSCEEIISRGWAKIKTT